MSPIDLLWLSITTDMPGVVYDLLGPQTGQRRPSVEHIAQPYGRPVGRGGGRQADSGSDR